MVEFHEPELGDQHWVEEILFQEENECCEYSFSNLFGWGKPYGLKIGRVEGRLTGYLPGTKGGGYLYPQGGGDGRAVLEALRADAAERNRPFRLLGLSRAARKELEGLYPDGFAIAEDRASFDYVYDIDRLADLPGKRLHAKRNHIYRFEEMYPDWTAEELTADNLTECLAMDEEWSRLNRGYDGDDSLADENVALHTVLAHREALGLEGLLLRADGRVVAFTVGRRMSPTMLDVHFEKAFGDIQGAYAMINREFARQIRSRHPEIRWLNREDDMGLAGLRKAKESYYPDRMVEKFIAEWKESSRLPDDREVF